MRRLILAMLLLGAAASPPLRQMLDHARTLEAKGQVRDAEGAYAAAVGLAVQARDAAAEADARGGLAEMQYERGAMADALANLQAAYRICERLGDVKGRLDALTVMANVYADANVAQYDRAIEIYKQLAGEYQKIGKPSDVGDTLFNLGSTLETKGNFAAAELQYRRALALFESLHAPRDVALTRRALGSALMKAGRANEALPQFDAAIAYFESVHDAGDVAYVEQFRGSAYRRLGRAADALRDLGAARDYYEKEGNARFVEKNTDETALVYEAMGDWANAYAFRKRNAALQQQLAATRRDELSSRLRVQFDAEKTEQENRALARENALRAVALLQAQRNEKLQLAVIALTAMLALALALLFWRQAAHTRRMRAMAMTDELTRLPNRRNILAVADIALRGSHRAALIMFDIDRFKRINDTYGHAAGDEVLQRVARACRLALRPADQLGRIGGEEFLVVLHDATGARQAADVAERLRAAVEELDFSSIAPDLRVTISLGVHVADGADVSAAIAAADALLYRAKENGRNRVEAA